MNTNSFIYKAHCEKGEPSSKRLWGGIGYGIVQLSILAATILSLCISHELSTVVKDVLEFDMATSAALLGLSSITSMFSGNKISAVSDNTQEENTETD